MMKKLTIYGLIALVLCTASCTKEDNTDDFSTIESLDIEIDSNGGEYTFPCSTIQVLTAPDEFNATITGNTIAGKYAGTTTVKVCEATLRAGITLANPITYDCNVTVKPSYTYYVDMAIYIGQSMSAIEQVYGSSISDNNSIYIYNPLSDLMPEYAVAFGYNDGKVVFCASFFTYSQSTNVITHLQQRYAFFGISDDVAYYGNALNSEDCSLFVSFNYSNLSNIYVAYLQNTGTTKSSDCESEYLKALNQMQLTNDASN